MITTLVPAELTSAADSYFKAFGHPVPHEVIELFAPRPGPLLFEIRHAIASGRPVQSWLTRSKGAPAGADGRLR